MFYKTCHNQPQEIKCDPCYQENVLIYSLPLYDVMMLAIKLVLYDYRLHRALDVYTHWDGEKKIEEKRNNQTCFSYFLYKCLYTLMKDAV